MAVGTVCLFPHLPLIQVAKAPQEACGPRSSPKKKVLQTRPHPSGSRRSWEARPRYQGLCKSKLVGDSEIAAAASNERLEYLVGVLERELPLQYEKDIDWSVYSPDLVFVDPVTYLEGKLKYRGMIATLRLAAAGLFKHGTVVFELRDVDEVPADALTQSPVSPLCMKKELKPVRALRTVWSTFGESRWGTELYISGDDIFRVGERGLIISHESAYDQQPSDIFGKWLPWTARG